MADKDADTPAAPAKKNVKGADAKANELKATVEGAQRQAALVDEVGKFEAERPRSTSHNAQDPDAVYTLGGYPVPAGAEHDNFEETVERKFYTTPGGENAEEVTVDLENGGVAEEDVWEAVYQNNAKTPTWVLVAAKGQVIPAGLKRHPGTTRMSDF